MSINIYDGLTDLKKGQEKIMILLNEMKEGVDTGRIYDKADILQLLKISPRTFATYIKDGILTYTKVGNKIWITEEQFLNFLEQNGSSEIADLKIRKGGINDTTK